MKAMKKILAVVLTLAMVMAMSITTWAATNGADAKYGTADDRGVITVSGITAENGLTVVAHPIVQANYDYSGSFSGYSEVYPNSVTINAETGEITVTDAQLTAILANVDTAKEVAMAPNADGTTYTATVPVGSYLVQISGAESKIYSNVVVSVEYKNDQGQNALNEESVDVVANGNAWVKVQDTPTLDKAIIENNEEVNGNTVKIGDTVNYQIKTTIPYYGGDYPKYYITDTLTGLSYNSEIVVNADGNTLTVGTDYILTVAETNDSFVINFVVDDAYTLNQYQGKNLVVTYSAHVDDDAALNNAGNLNNARLDYTRDSKVDGNDDFVEDMTKTYTFDIDAVGEGALTTNVITKYGQTSTTTSAPLAGAEFTLYTDAACTTVYSNDIWEGVVISDDAGQLTMEGLDEGTYYLKETKAPGEYTLNNTVYEIVIDANIDENGELLNWTITVDDTMIENGGTKTSTFEVATNTNTVTKTVNETGIQNTKIATLPSTGGIGTTIFTVGGCLIMIAAAAMFFMSRRKNEAE